MSGPSVLILAGGLSHERDVSLRSGRRVADALRQADCLVTEFDLGPDMIPGLKEHPVDLVWPLLHGASGEDGSVREVLELLGQPYLGSNPRASRVAWNKAVAKTTLVRAGLTTPQYLALPQAMFRELGADQLLALINQRFGLPVVVKPLQGGSALGITRVDQAERLPRAMMDCFAYGECALIERAIDGVELAVSVLDLGDGPFALPAVEICTDGPYDYDARYNPGRTEFFTPARVTPEQATMAGEVAIQAHQRLGLERISRTDMVLANDGAFYFLEVNVAPGMQETSLLPQAALAGGYQLPVLYRDLVKASINNPRP